MRRVDVGDPVAHRFVDGVFEGAASDRHWDCLLYTSDAADERSSGDLGGRGIIKKKNREQDMGIGVTKIQMEDRSTPWHG